MRPPKDGERAEPRVKLSCGVKPCIKLRKSIEALGTTLSFGADYHVREKEAHFETTWHDPRLGGQLSLRDLSTLEWRKTWLFPGIADAATRVEVRSTLDLQTAQPDVRLKLGLRRSFASSGMSFVQDVPLDGADGHCKVSVGATVTVPDELQLSAADVPAVVRRGRAADVPLLNQAYVAVDLDRLDLLIEY